MNTSIVELKELLVNNEISTVNDGLLLISQYLDGFEFHECKEEWTKMTKKNKQSFVKKLLETVEITDEVTESDIDDGLVEPTELSLDEAREEDERLKQEEINQLVEQINRLEEQLKPLKERLFELTGQSNEKETKMEKAVRIYESNPGLKRKDMLILFQQQAGLTKSGSATYFNNIRNIKKKS